jgi:hypothetical protein
MIVEPANVVAAYTDNRPQKTTGQGQITAEQNNNNEGTQELGQTSDFGPAVVTNISATALEATKAVTPTEQTADTAKNKGSEDQDTAPPETIAMAHAYEKSQEQRIDVVV